MSAHTPRHARRPLLCHAWRPLLLFALLSLPAAGLAAQAADPAVLLERARYEEDVRGDLEAAVLLYRTVVEEHGHRRDLAARALLELGEAYELLGREEAGEAYRRIVTEYADQAVPAMAARSRLEALRPRESQTRTGVVARQIWASPAMFGPGSVSPDGTELAFIDWGGSVDDPTLPNRAEPAVVDTRTGRARPVAGAPPLDTYALDPVWRDDGGRIAFSVWDTTWTHMTVHTARPDGSDERVLLGENRYQHIHPQGWRSATDEIAALVEDWDGVDRIGLISGEDGSLRILRSLGKDWHGDVAPSPDGRLLAYAAPAEDGPGAHDLHILHADGSLDVVVAAHPADDRFPRWTPDGRRLLFVSDRAGERGLWSVAIRDGAQAGDPELVQSGVGAIRPIDVTASGALAYVRENNRSFVQVAELDLEAGRFRSEPRAVGEGYVGTNSMPSWSPDGHRLAYYSLRGAGADRSAYLVVKEMAAGTERALPLPFLPYGPASSPSWSEDGAHLLVEGGGGRSRVSYRVDTDTGEVTERPHLRSSTTRAASHGAFATARQSAALRALGIRLAGQNDHFPYMEGDAEPRPGETVLHVRNGVWTLDPTRPQEEWEPWLEGGQLHMHANDLSPDGGTLALAIADDELGASNRLVLLDLERRRTHELARLPASEEGEIGAVRWTPDGRHLLFVVIADDDDEVRPVQAVSVESGRLRRLELELSPSGLMSLQFHPDGGTVAYTRREMESQVWLLEGLPWQAGSRP